ncbi:MAG TPA: S41 family peptidase [Bryobacteraceae bacterium]|jgi:carboxyl-terminal processing protease
MHRLLALLAIPSLCTQVWAQAPRDRQVNLDSFEKVWSTIRDKHWEKNPGGLDWQAIHAEFRPKVEQAKNIDEVRAILKDMLSRLHQTHFGILPATVYEDAGLPADLDAGGGDGSAGIDLRVLDGQAVVTRVDPGSPAERAGVKPGWAVELAGGVNLQAAASALAADPSIPELIYTRVLLNRISGPVGGKTQITFLDGAGAEEKRELDLAAPRGEMSSFGNLPETPVWFESKILGTTGYIRFNYFLDLQHVMEGFGGAVKACQECGGMIIDLRGNPGGIGAMAMGMAGYFLDQPGLRLGTMYMRDAQLNFAVNPRFPGFSGPLAILVDACSASTSEIFAGGLQDLHRARIFGSRSAAAALPSVIERLPNGDGFQYAVGNYVSEGGKPLEGEGVKPDVEVKLTRAALLAGHDAVVDAAVDWIGKAGR